MTDLCRIENGIVTNRAHFNGAVPEGWIPEGETWVENAEAQIGWTYADGVFTAPPRALDPPPDNYRPMIRYRADKLEAAGDSIGALKLRLTIGDI